MESQIQFIPHEKDDLDFFDDVTDGLNQSLLTNEIFIGQVRTEAPFLLEFINDNLTLHHQPTGQSFSVNFNRGKVFHRVFFDPTKTMLIKAIEGRSKEKLNIIDATAGFGSDLFQLASRGHDVIAIERNLIVYLLLKDALFRAEDNPQTHPITQHITLLYGNAVDLISRYGENSDIIYLDPMFPQTKKSAKVQKEMQILQTLHQDDHDNQWNDEQLFNIATQNANKVVVKRPASGPYLNEKKPSSSLVGKSNRFDIYAR
ncbi:class I SAM-dependent methyltransferase [Thiotrichales bacterium 19S3-7]|nr:class I SAM-dependent methyltransferase [Thiotrichales bacterium 19S3-7]MCF6801332.1 class I SAM-dependent methyltransferase [Thiotrichales bacterium 19S3-11]